MSRWFRHYAGMMRDDKLVRAALKSGQPIERVVWVWGAILESAAEIDDGGKFEVDAAEISYFLHAPLLDVEAVFSTLETLGRINGSVVVKWGERQFQSDRSAERQRRHREGRKQIMDGAQGDGATVTNPARDADITSPSRHGDAPETETDTQTETEKDTPSLRSGVGRATRAKRASRVPENFVPSTEDAFEAGLSEEETLLEVANFLDYWRAKPSNATKLDWPATWRVWCRKAAKDRGSANRGRGPPRDRVVNGFAAHALRLAREEFDPTDRNGFSPAGHATAGPRDGNPRAPDCLVDAERSEPAGDSH